MARQRRLRRRSTEDRAERRVRPLPGHPRIEHQQRRPVLPAVPVDGRARCVDDVRRRRHQHVDELDQPKSIVTWHRQGGPGNPGEPCAWRDEQCRARRRDAVRQQLPCGCGEQFGAQAAGDLQLRGRRRERTCGDRTLHGIALGLRTVRVRQGLCEFLQRRNQSRLLHHPRDRPRWLSDDAQAGVGGDADVSEPQNQCLPRGGAHGHVDQATSSAVMSRP